MYMVSPPENQDPPEHQDLSKTLQQAPTVSSGLNFSLTQRALSQQTRNSPNCSPAYFPTLKKKPKRKYGKLKFIFMILDYLHYQEFNNAVRGAEINVPPAPESPKATPGRTEGRMKKVHSSPRKKSFLRNEKTTKSTLLWQSF